MTQLNPTIHPNNAPYMDPKLMVAIKLDATLIYSGREKEKEENTKRGCI